MAEDVAESGFRAPATCFPLSSKLYYLLMLKRSCRIEISCALPNQHFAPGYSSNM